MNAYEQKHTGEIRSQEFSPGDDRELIAKPSWKDYAIGFVALALFVIFLVLAEGK